MIRRPPRSTRKESSAASDVYKRQIYDGQLSVLKNTPVGPTIQHMKDQEQEHLDTFNKLLYENDTRPTALLPLWNVMGFGLGVASALMGEKAAMACTIAVEEVIGEHYAKQAESLNDDHKELKSTLMLSLIHIFEPTRPY